MLNRADITIIILCMATMFATNVLLLVVLLEIKNILADKINTQKILNALFAENITRIAKYVKGDENDEI